MTKWFWTLVLIGRRKEQTHHRWASCFSAQALILLAAILPFGSGAQTTDAWSVTTSLTGPQVFESLTVAEAAVRSIGASEAHLAHTGRSVSNELTTTLYYAASPERRPVEEPEGAEYGFPVSNQFPCGNAVWPWEPGFPYEECVPAGGWYNSYAEIEAHVASVATACGITPPVTLVGDWTPSVNSPDTAQSNVIQAINPLYHAVGTCQWSPFSTGTVEGVIVRESALGFDTCPSGYTFDPAHNDCFNSATAEIYVTNLIDAEDCPVGNPCLPSNGAKVQKELDYEGKGIRFERTYRSDYPSMPRDSLLGPGWFHNYEARIEIDSDTNEPDRALRPNGRIIRLIPNGVDEWRGAGGDLTVRLLGAEYRAYLDNGAYEAYDATGILLRTVDAAGRQTQLTYADVGEYRLLAIVKGPYGHALSFRWSNLGSPSAAAWRLTSVKDPAGAEIVYNYTPGSQPVLGRVIYQDGTDVEYHHEEVGFPTHLTGITDERGIRYATFDYDTRGRVTLSEHAGGYEHWTLGYGTDIVTATDGRLINTVYRFQPGVGSGRFVDSIERANESTFRTNEPGDQLRLVSSTDRRGLETRFSYDDLHLTSITEAYGTTEARQSTFEYLNDSSELLRFERRPSVCQDGQTRIAEVETQYAPGTQRVSARIERGFVLDTGASACVPITRATQYLNYNNKGDPRLINGPRQDVSDTTTITYNPCADSVEHGSGCGQIATLTNAVGLRWTFNTYNPHGQVTRITQPNQAVLDVAYDARLRLRTITETASGLPARTTTYDYYDNGLLQRVTDPTLAFVEYTYNDARLLTEIRDNNGNRIEYGYDLAGNRTSETIHDPAGTITSSRTMDYDDFNNLDTVSLPKAAGGSDVWNYSFGPTGLLESVTSPEGRTTSYDDYDALGRLRSFVNALSQRTTYAYDAQDNLISVTALTTPSYPAGVITSYVYDDFGRQVREESADRGVLTREYDAADNLLLTVDARGLSTDYVYDALNRLRTIQVEPQGGGLQETLSIVYNDTTADGRRGQIVSASAQNGMLAYAYGYDGFGRRISEQLSYTGLSTAALTQYTYDGADRIEEIRRGTPTQPNLWVTHTLRDAGGVITDIEDQHSTPVDIVSDVQHMPFGPYRTIHFANGHAVTRVFDQRYRVSASSIPSGYSQALTWTSDDNIERAETTVSFSNTSGQGTHDYTFGFDALNRVERSTWIESEGPLQERLYEYDGDGQHGNLTHTSITDFEWNDVHARNFTYGAGTNRLTQIEYPYPGWGVRAVTQDASGNMLSTAAAFDMPDLQYDSLGQLRLAHAHGNPANVRGRYDFNHLGERARKETTDAGVTQVTLFTYLANGQLLGETIFNNGVFAEQRDYVWMDSTPVAMHTTKLNMAGAVTFDQTHYLHADHLDTPLWATNAAGLLSWHFRDSGNSVYGEGYSSFFNDGSGMLFGTTQFNLRFPGQYADWETGLNYNYFRDYDAVTGRYIQSDPIGLAGGLNTYLYANGNPLRYIDPFGLAGCYVGFPGYPITVPGTSVKVPLTHAGVLSYDTQGRTRYYEYGRYDTDSGEVKRRSVPDLKLEQDGKPTPESWAKMLERLTELGHGTKPKTTCDADADAEKINLFAEDRMHDPNRAPYSWNPFNMNTCTTFASDALDAGR